MRLKKGPLFAALKGDKQAMREMLVIGLVWAVGAVAAWQVFGG